MRAATSVTMPIHCSRCTFTPSFSSRRRGTQRYTGQRTPDRHCPPVPATPRRRRITATGDFVSTERDTHTRTHAWGTHPHMKGHDSNLSVPHRCSHIYGSASVLTVPGHPFSPVPLPLIGRHAPAVVLLLQLALEDVECNELAQPGAERRRVTRFEHVRLFHGP